MSNPFHRSEAPKEISEVNIVPLADVSLVLLILLMVLSPMMTQDMLKVKAAAESNTPQEEPPQPRPPEMVLVVAIHPKGISVGENFFASMGAFVTHMKTLLSAREDKKVFLAPEPGISTGRVVNMLEMLKTCGATSVALVQSVEASPDMPLPEGFSAARSE